MVKQSNIESDLKEVDRINYLKKTAIINKFINENYKKEWKEFFYGCIDIYELIICNLAVGLGVSMIINSQNKSFKLFVCIMIGIIGIEFIGILIYGKLPKIESEKSAKLRNNTFIGNLCLNDIDKLCKDSRYYYQYNNSLEYDGLKYVFYNSHYGLESFSNYDEDLKKLNELHLKIDKFFNSISNEELINELQNFEKINNLELGSFIRFNENPKTLSYELSEMSRYYATIEHFKNIDEEILRNNSMKFLRIPNSSYDYIIKNKLNGDQLIAYVKSVKY